MVWKLIPYSDDSSSDDEEIKEGTQTIQLVSKTSQEKEIQANKNTCENTSLIGNSPANTLVTNDTSERNLNELSEIKATSNVNQVAYGETLSSSHNTVAENEGTQTINSVSKSSQGKESQANKNTCENTSLIGNPPANTWVTNNTSERNLNELGEIKATTNVNQVAYGETLSSSDNTAVESDISQNEIQSNESHAVPYCKSTLLKENVSCPDVMQSFSNGNSEQTNDETNKLEMENGGKINENMQLPLREFEIDKDELPKENASAETLTTMQEENTNFTDHMQSSFTHDKPSILDENAERIQGETSKPEIESSKPINEKSQLIPNITAVENVYQRDARNFKSTHALYIGDRIQDESITPDKENHMHQNTLFSTNMNSSLNCNHSSSLGKEGSSIADENVQQNNYLFNARNNNNDDDETELKKNTDSLKEEQIRGKGNTCEVEMEDSSSDSDSDSSEKLSLHSSSPQKSSDVLLPSIASVKETDQEDWKWDSDFDASSDESICELPIAKRKKKVQIKPILELVDLYGEESAQPVAEFPNIQFDSKALEPIGKVSGIIDIFLKVSALPKKRQLYYDTWLFTKDGTPIGQIFEIWGQVSSPTYNIRFNTPEDVEKTGLREKEDVYFVANHNKLTKYVDIELTKQFKGTDASWTDDKEVPPEFADYSDDESERRAKKKRRRNQKIPCITIDDDQDDDQQGSANADQNESNFHHPRRIRPKHYRQNSFQSKKNFCQPFTSSSSAIQQMSYQFSSPPPTLHPAALPDFRTPPPQPPGSLPFSPLYYSSSPNNMQQGVPPYHQPPSHPLNGHVSGQQTPPQFPPSPGLQRAPFLLSYFTHPPPPPPPPPPQMPPRLPPQAPPPPPQMPPRLPPQAPPSLGNFPPQRSPYPPNASLPVTPPQPSWPAPQLSMPSPTYAPPSCSTMPFLRRPPP